MRNRQIPACCSCNNERHRKKVIMYALDRKPAIGKREPCNGAVCPAEKQGVFASPVTAKECNDRANRQPGYSHVIGLNEITL
jgi:hypothetical protein